MHKENNRKDETMKDDLISLILVIAAVAITALMILGLFFINIPKDNKDMVNIVVGIVIGGAFATLYTWRFGSSKSSAVKTDIMSNTYKELTEKVFPLEPLKTDVPSVP
jgi:flagellar basal body-associated protein FliL